MKTYITILILLSVQLFYGQDIFEKYAQESEVTYVSISPAMFEMLGQINVSTDDPESKEFLEMLKTIKTFKVLETENDDIGADISSWVKKQVKKEKLEELIAIKENDNTNLIFYVKQKKGDTPVVEKLLLFAKEIKSNATNNFNETVIIWIEGEIELEKISKIAEKTNFPGMDKLNQLKSQ